MSADTAYAASDDAEEPNYAAEEPNAVDDTPPYVRQDTADDDTVIEGEDISASEPMGNDDFIEPAKGVRMYVKGATLDTYTPKGEEHWMRRSLKVTLVIGKDGVDGKGRYRNKHFFPRLLVQVNREAYPDAFTSQFYTPKTGGAWGDYNFFLKALGFSTSPAPRNDKAFRDGLKDRELTVNINKSHPRVKDSAGKWNPDKSSWENTLEYVLQAAATKAASKAAAPVAVEEA